MTKSTKSHLRGLSSLLKNTLRVHELVAKSIAWQVCAAKDRMKVGGFTAPHGFSYTTRANISHEKAEQIRARIACTPAEKKRGGRGSGTCADGTIKINPISLCSHPDTHHYFDPRGSP